MLTRFRMRMTRSGVAQLWFEDQTHADVLPDGQVDISSPTGDAERFQRLFNDTGTPERSVRTDPEARVATTSAPQIDTPERDSDDEPSFGP
jgi:hypothetical protein